MLSVETDMILFFICYRKSIPQRIEVYSQFVFKKLVPLNARYTTSSYHMGNVITKILHSRYSQVWPFLRRRPKALKNKEVEQSIPHTIDEVACKTRQKEIWPIITMSLKNVQQVFKFHPTACDWCFIRFSQWTMSKTTRAELRSQTTNYTIKYQNFKFVTNHQSQPTRNESLIFTSCRLWNYL